MVHVDVSLLRFLADTALPVMAAFFMRRFASEKVKSAIMAVLAFVMAIVQDLIMLNGDFIFSVFVSNFVSALVVGLLAHQFVWKPMSVTGDHGVILKSIPSGIGKPEPAKLYLHMENKRAAA